MPLNKLILPHNSCSTCEHRPLRMFCNLGPVAFAEFDKLGVNGTYRAGTQIFHEGDPANHVIILCTGYVKLSCDSRDGKTMNLKIAAPGDVLGLGAVVSHENFEVSGVAIRDTTAKVITREKFLTFLAHQGEASLHAARALAEDYKSAFADARRLALSASVPSRLASLLLDWGGAGQCGHLDMRFTMFLTHEELAGFVASTRETVTRALSKFQRDELISIDGATIHILKPKKLASLAA